MRLYEGHELLLTALWEHTYHLTELLIESVTRSATSLLIGNFRGDPVAQMLLVLFCELCTSVFTSAV